jgi:hypothetical protein
MKLRDEIEVAGSSRPAIGVQGKSADDGIANPFAFEKTGYFL